MNAAHMLSKVKTLPTISAAALKLTSLLGRRDTDNDEVVRIIKQDTVLTAKLMRMCNSPALGLAVQVGSVDQAVLLLGYAQIFRMVTGVAFQGALGTALKGYSLGANALWQHSLLAAIAAEQVVTQSQEFASASGVDSSSAFTIGLLHDIGKVVTDQFITRNDMIAMRERVRDGHTLIQAERAVLGTDHAEVGSSLLHLWRLPETVVEAVAGHHEPALKPYGRLSVLAWLANTAAHRALRPKEHCPPASETGTIDSLGFGETIDSLVNAVRDTFSASEKLGF